MTDFETKPRADGAPIISGSYSTTVSTRLDFSLVRKSFSVLAPAVKDALEAKGLTVMFAADFLRISGPCEAHLPPYRMDEEIWGELKSHGYKLRDVIPVEVRNVFSGGQHGRNQARMYMYPEFTTDFSTPEPLFVAKGEGGHVLLSKVGEFARAHPSGLPDFDQIVQCLIEPEYESQRWAPRMSDMRGLVGSAHLTGPGQPAITYLADSMVAMVDGDGGVEPILLPNADGKPRFVATWAELIRR